MKYEERYVWSIPLRLFHWVFVAAIVLLTATGLLIYMPQGIGLEEGATGGANMGVMKATHYLAGVLFTMALMVRLYLLVVGNKHEKLADFAPVSKRNIKNVFTMAAFYLYFKDDHEHRDGHNVLAGLSYLTIFFLAVVQVCSGFFMRYPESGFFAWAGMFFFRTLAEARFVHHTVMWFIIIFAVIHVYIAVWNDIKSPHGLISSIINGRKYVPVGEDK